MGLFDRLSTLLRSNINDLISRAEDPEKMLNQIIVDMRSQLAKAKQQVATAIADEKRLRDQADAEFKQGSDWEAKAMLAIKESRDDLAKQALMRQSEHNSHGQQLAQTQKRIHETMSSLSEKSAFEAFARMEERIENNERQLKASVEIEEEFTGDRLAQDFKQLERSTTSNSVDGQLLALKQKMGMLPAGSNPPEAKKL